MTTSNMKMCCKCSKVKHVDEFYPSLKNDDGLRKDCISCYKLEPKKQENKKLRQLIEHLREEMGMSNANHS